MKKNYSKIAILGNSKKFLDFIKKNFVYEDLDVISWRKIRLLKKKKKYDLIFICGFAFNLYLAKFEDFYNINVKYPLDLLYKISNKNSLIIYINTKDDKKKYTFSRYRFAKNKLAYEIIRNFKKKIIVNIDLITINKKISVNSDSLSKYIFYLFSKLNLIKTIELKNVFLKIERALKKNNLNKLKNIKGCFMNLPRTQFLDRTLRILIG